MNENEFKERPRQTRTIADVIALAAWLIFWGYILTLLVITS